MTLALRRWLFAAGLAEQWREFARLGAKEKEDIEMIERDDVRRDKGSALTHIEVNRLFRAIGEFFFIIVWAIGLTSCFVFSARNRAPG